MYITRAVIPNHDKEPSISINVRDLSFEVTQSILDNKKKLFSLSKIVGY